MSGWATWNSSTNPHVRYHSHTHSHSGRRCYGVSFGWLPRCVCICVLGKGRDVIIPSYLRQSFVALSSSWSLAAARASGPRGLASLVPDEVFAAHCRLCFFPYIHSNGSISCPRQRSSIVCSTTCVCVCLRLERQVCLLLSSTCCEMGVCISSAGPCYCEPRSVTAGTDALVD